MKKHSAVPQTLAASLLVSGLAGTTTIHGAAPAFPEAELYFELNNTDGDLGIHGSIDGGPWRKVNIRDPNNKLILSIRSRGMLTQQGMTQLFFESAEPNFDDTPPEDFFARFPEGTYKILGWGHQGGRLRSESRVRHVLPAAPDGIKVSGQPIAPTCDDAAPEYDESKIPTVDDDEPVIISWDRVTDAHPTLGHFGNVQVQLYQVFVSTDTLVAGEVFSSKYAFELPRDTTSVSIPEEILALGEEFKIEVLVKETEGGNQSATESCFFVLEDEDED